MLKFEGNINGKVYTDEKEFYYDLSKLDKKDYRCISYRYVSVPGILDVDNEKQKDNRNFIEYNKNIDEGQYVRNITNENDVVPEKHLIDKLKSASNKLEIKNNVCNKIKYFDNEISNNLLHINDLKAEYKKLEEKINLITNQIKTLDDANNNYYLNKEYYTNIKNELELNSVQVNNIEQKKKCDCEGKRVGNCKCNKKNLEYLLNEIGCKTYEDFINGFGNLSDLVEYFIKKRED